MLVWHWRWPTSTGAGDEVGAIGIWQSLGNVNDEQLRINLPLDGCSGGCSSSSGSVGRRRGGSSGGGGRLRGSGGGRLRGSDGVSGIGSSSCAGSRLALAMVLASRVALLSMTAMVLVLTLALALLALAVEPGAVLASLRLVQPSMLGDDLTLRGRWRWCLRWHRGSCWCWHGH